MPKGISNRTKRVGNRSYLIVLAFAALLAVTPLRILSLLLIVLVISRLLRAKMLGFLSHLVLGFLVVVSLTSLISLTTWIFGWTLSSSKILLYLVLVIFIYVYAFTRSPRPLLPQKNEVLDLGDFASFALACALVTVLCLPFIRDPTIPTLGQLVMAGGDNSTHMELVKLNDINQNVSYGTNNKVNVLTDMSNYPQAWHFFTVFISWCLNPLISSSNIIGRFLLIFYMMSVLWFAVLVFLLVRSSVWLGENIIGKYKPSNKISVIGAVGVTGAAAIGWLVTLFAYGFQTQIAASVFLVAEVIILLIAWTHNEKDRRSYLRLAMLFAATSMFMWFFVGSASIVALALGYMLTYVKTRSLPHLEDWVLGLVLGLLVLLQASFRSIFKLTTVDNGSLLTSTGLVEKVDLYWLLIGFVMISLFFYAKMATKKYVVLYATLLSSLIFSFGILVYQLQATGEPRYFYYKANYTILILLLIPLGACVFYLVHRLFDTFQRNKIGKNFVALSVMVLMFMVVWPMRSPLFDSYVDNQAFGVERRQAEAVVEILSKDRSAGYRTVSIGSCNRGNDIRTVQLARSLAFTNKTIRTSADFLLTVQSKEYLFKEIEEFTMNRQEKLILISNDRALEAELYTQLGKLDKNIELYSLDTTIETETKFQCPDRIRTLTPEEYANTFPK
jgi:hypothetical protein